MAVVDLSEGERCNFDSPYFLPTPVPNDTLGCCGLMATNNLNSSSVPESVTQRWDIESVNGTSVPDI